MINCLEPYERWPYLLKVYLPLDFHTKNCITEASNCPCDPDFERTLDADPENLLSPTEESYHYKIFMSLTEFYWKISSRD